MADATIRILADARDRVAERAAAEGLSPRAYHARLADDLLMPAERAERAAAARTALHAWNGYDPDDDEQPRLDSELDRRLAEARTRSPHTAPRDRE